MPTRPGQKLFLTRSFRAPSTVVQPVATQRRRPARRLSVDPLGGVDRDDAPSTAGVRDAGRRREALAAFEHVTRRPIITALPRSRESAAGDVRLPMARRFVSEPSPRHALAFTVDIRSQSGQNTVKMPLGATIRSAGSKVPSLRRGRTRRWLDAVSWRRCEEALDHVDEFGERWLVSLQDVVVAGQLHEVAA